MSFKKTYFQMVEVIITAAITGQNAQTAIPQQNQLQSVTGDKKVYVKCIESYTSDDLTLSPLTTGSAVATAADLANAVLTLRVKGADLIKQVPLSRMRGIFGANGPSNYDLWELKDTYEIDWTQSYITTLAVPGSGGTTAAPFSYLLGVHYSYDADPIDLKPVNLQVFTAKQ